MTDSFAQNDGPTCRPLRGLVGLCELLLPGRARAYYLIGSHADGSAVPGSDIDLLVVFRDGTPKSEIDALGRALDHCGLMCPAKLDATLLTEDDLRRTGAVWVHRRGRLLHGESVEAVAREQPPAEYLRRHMHTAFAVLARVHGRGGPLAVPLAPADPDGPWLGLDRPAATARDPDEWTWLRELVASTAWAAQALTLARGGTPAWGRRDDVAPSYRAAVGDEWSGLVEAVMRRCRRDWGYRVPDGDADRRELRERRRRRPRAAGWSGSRRR
jgi:predicted nucleotidyltransferase